MTREDQTLTMDRISEELSEMRDTIDILIDKIELYYKQDLIPDEVYEELGMLKEFRAKVSDWMTMAKNWRPIADLNGVDLG